jgi:hypothetical protein
MFANRAQPADLGQDGRKCFSHINASANSMATDVSVNLQ